MRIRILYIVTLVVLFAFGIRVVTYAERNFAPSHSIAVVSLIKAKSESDQKCTKTQGNAWSSLRFSMLQVVAHPHFKLDQISYLVLNSEVSFSVDLHALRRPPRA